MLNALIPSNDPALLFKRARTPEEYNLLTRAPVDLALALFFVRVVWMGVSHPLTLDGLQRNAAKAFAGKFATRSI